MIVSDFFPALKGLRHSEFTEAIREAKQQVALNDDKVREICAHLLKDNTRLNALSASILDPVWAIFRWIQVRIIYSLDLLLSYQGELPTKVADKFWRRIEHEMLDAEYVTLASLAGALASNDRKLIKRFILVRPPGSLLFTSEGLFCLDKKARF